MSEYDQIPCVELIRHYRPGGFHPVHLNDTFNNGRYRVVNKLGHGGFSTVWLVKDEITQKYASLKILAAEASDSERLILRHLQRNCLDDRGGEYVLRLLDDFVHSGPNGDHQCIVTEVLGPSLASDIEDLYPDEQFPIDIAKRMSAQITHGIQYLHRNGVVHGGMFGCKLVEVRRSREIFRPLPQKHTPCPLFTLRTRHRTVFRHSPRSKADSATKRNPPNTPLSPPQIRRPPHSHPKPLPFRPFSGARQDL